MARNKKTVQDKFFESFVKTGQNEFAIRVTQDGVELSPYQEMMICLMKELILQQKITNKHLECASGLIITNPEDEF